MDLEKIVQLLRKTINECEEQMAKCGHYHRGHYVGRMVLAKDILYVIEGSTNVKHGNV